MVPRRVLLVTSDLMASSRISGTLAALGDSLDVRGSLAGLPAEAAYDVVLIDIQACRDPAQAIAVARQAAGTAGRVVAFGPHVWQDSLAAAVEAGAHAAATRGEVMEGLAGLLDRLNRP